MRLMKAASEELTIQDVNNLTYPVMAGPKYDGIRGGCHSGEIRSQTNNRIPCPSVHQAYVYGLDGELLVPGGFNAVQSAIMSQRPCSNFTYWVFDLCLPELHSYSYKARYAKLVELMKTVDSPAVKLAPMRLCNSPEEVWAFFHEVMQEPEGFDGIIIRDPNAPYKLGRSTLKQGWMLKLKPWKDAEAEIIGFEELLSNSDTSCKKQENLVPMDTLGAFICRMPNGKVFNCGGGKGLTAEERKKIWENKEKYLGSQLCYKYLFLSDIGIPRHPNYKGIRFDV